MTYQVETCRSDIYTVVYEINVMLLTDIQYLFVCYNISGWKTSNSKKHRNLFRNQEFSHNSGLGTYCYNPSYCFKACLLQISICFLLPCTGGADKSLARPGRKQANVSVRMASISFGPLPCRKRNLMTAQFSILLKSHTSLTCFRACLLPGQAKDLSAPRV